MAGSSSLECADLSDNWKVASTIETISREFTLLRAGGVNFDVDFHILAKFSQNRPTF